MKPKRVVKNIDDLQNQLLNDTDLQNDFKNNPLDTIQQIEQQNPLGTDVWIYRIIVLALGFTILSIIVGVIVLIANEKIKDDQGVPTILTAIGSAAIGALAGLLAPAPKTA
jgi:hypothetical protein